MATKKYEEMSLKERHEAERAYQLGKTDINPVTGKTVAEEKAAHAQAKKEADALLVKQMSELGVDIEASEPVVAPSATADTKPLPTRRQLEAMGKNDVVEQAVLEGIDPAGVENKADVIERIMANRPATG